jgi:WD40 repeat protein
VKLVLFSPDGREIVSADSISSIRLWDAKGGAAIGSPLYNDVYVGLAEKPRSIAVQLIPEPVSR